MSVQTVDRTAVEDAFGPHPAWCNPAECEPGDTLVFDGHTVGIDAIHQRTIATFDALHEDINDRLVPVRLTRELCGDEDRYVLRVGAVAVRVTAEQLAALQVTS